MKRQAHLLLLFCVFFTVIHIWDVYAQVNSNQLVFTKAMIDKKNSKVWFEVFNPTKENIPLTNFMMSGVKSSNILPPDIRKENAIVVKSNERVIICGNKKSFENDYGKVISLIEIELLREIGDQGFVGVNCSRGMEDSYNIIQFAKKSTNVKNGEDTVLSFSNGILSYTREVTTNGAVSSWLKTNPAINN